ncbi:hypothetical protein CSB11_01265 [Candidatus Campbellbacteria bacterium]|nr:MAG: hypothetical protein CSB11_01265 [Candidatus Campbellbacteria bacterium]
MTQKKFKKIVQNRIKTIQKPENRTLKNILFVVFLVFFFLAAFVYFKNSGLQKQIVLSAEENQVLFDIFEDARNKNSKKNIEIFVKNFLKLKEEKCLKIEIQKDVFCDLKNESAKECLLKTEILNFNPTCVLYKSFHLKKPQNIKAIYYSAYAAASAKKIDYLIELAEKSDINAVVIDIKEADGGLSVKIPTDGFEIKPKILNIIKNPKALIEKLHQKGIYVIARVVVFKDKNLVRQYPEFAVKRSDQKTIWKDHRHKTWLDANNPKVWDYIAEISKQVYLLGFDEVNLDYVRFPSDGPMRDIYYPYSNSEIVKSPRWGRAKVMDDFYFYYTQKLRKTFPEIQLSADVFGQVALNWDDVSIGQILESAVLYFDGIYPMAYPSHYSWRFLPQYTDGPDNHPYEVIEKTIKASDKKIEDLNQKIAWSIENKKPLTIRPGVVSKIKPEDLKIIQKNKVKFWLQAFYCSWCRNSKPYGLTEILLQKKALEDSGHHNWLFWNASSRYKESHFVTQENEWESMEG